MKYLSRLNGLYYIYWSNSLNNFFLQTYDALAYHVSQATMNRRRMKTVSLWSLQMTASAVLSALRNSIDPMSAQLKEAYAHSSGHELNFTTSYL